jgi:hypothetical protein
LRQVSIKDQMKRRRTAASYRAAALKGWRTRHKNKRKRSNAAKKGWQTRRKAAVAQSRKRSGRKTPLREPQRKGGRGTKQPVPTNREYFVVLIFETRKRGKMQRRRLWEAMVTAPDGSTDEKVIEKYAEWIQQNEKSLHNINIERMLYGPNRGRKIEIKVVPRSEPTDEPAGVQRNDSRPIDRPKRRRKKK